MMKADLAAARKKWLKQAETAAERKRREAEQRNARHRLTRGLRPALEKARADLAAAQRDLVEATDRLADPSVYTDGALVRDLVERHNTARDRIDELGAEERRLVDEIEAAETQDTVGAAR